MDLFLESGLKGFEFVRLMEDVRTVLQKDVDVLDKTHVVSGSKISSEIAKEGIVIYEK